MHLGPRAERQQASTTYHEEGISDPQAPPSRRAVGDGDVLAVDGNGNGRGLAHGAAADVGPDVLLGHRHHGQRGGGGEPVGLVVPAGVVADVARVAVQEGHRAEPGQAGARQPCGAARDRHGRACREDAPPGPPRGSAVCGAGRRAGSGFPIPQGLTPPALCPSEVPRTPRDQAGSEGGATWRTAPR